MVMPCFFFTCKMPGDIYNNGSFIGKYKSIEFIVSGPADGGIDLLSYGAFVHLELKKQRKFQGSIFIPDSIPVAKLSWGNEHNNGSYYVQRDTVFFGKHLPFGIPDKFKWIRTKNQLIYEWKGRGYHKMVLQKE